MTPPNRFAFLDESESFRRLGVDHATLLALVREGRLRAYPGVGKGSFFKAGDLDKLARELHPQPAEPRVDTEPPAPNASEAAPKRPQHDPAYKVHLRLTADLKWYDLKDDDLRAWVRELHPEGYERQRTNINAVIARLNRLLALIDEAASGWRNLPRGTAGDGE